MFDVAFGVSLLRIDNIKQDISVQKIYRKNVFFSFFGLSFLG